MPATTPVYGWPYQSLPDPPDGPNLGEDLGIAIENTVLSLQSRIQQLEANVPAIAANLPIQFRSSQITTGSVPSVLFSDIPTNLRHLRLVYSARGDNASHAQFLHARINADAGAQYHYSYIQVNNATVAGASATGVAQEVVGFSTGSLASAGQYASGVCDWSGWDSPHANGLGHVFTFQCLGNGIANFFAGAGGGSYSPVGPYTSITLLPGNGGNIIAGSEFTLYGFI